MNSRNLLLSAFACLALALVAAGCATPAPSGQTCGAGQMSCSGTCANVQTDNQNCGTCGTKCGTGKSCQAGVCKCGAGLLDCAGQCLPSSSSNCGSCGMTCSGTQVCNNGTCANSCTAPAMQCSGGTCANVMTDSAHCGSCGNACQGGSTCMNGSCGCATAGQMYCNSACIDTNTNMAHCGGCNRPCTGTCANGVCTATTGAGGRGGSGAGGSGGGVAGRGGSGGSGPAGGGGSGPAGGGGSGPAGTGAGGGATGAGGARACGVTSPIMGVAAADVISDFEEGYGVMVKQGGRTGYWAPYNNTADPQNQTPAKPADAMADKIAVAASGSTDMCNKYAFASSATGQDNYVGFGAQFHPNMPLTASDVADAYDVSAYDGIVFRAKTGGGPASQPVFVEILTKETQPSTSGGAAVDQAIDLYNNRGLHANVNSTDYKTFYVPFGAMYPRSLPAPGNTTSQCRTLKCQAPKFVPANALAIQFSFYGAMDTPGFPQPSPSGSYNLVVDDVAFYKRSALPAGTNELVALPSSGGMHPLQDNPTINSRCSKPTGASGKLLALAYDNWKRRFVRAGDGGQKVIRPENGDDTVSEGIAYGMMIAVYMDDKALFDGLYTYWKAHLHSGTPLMTWCIPAGANSCSASGGTATDSDEDAAFAMLMASKQWPSGGYAATATTLINAVMSTDMAGTYIKAGSNYSATGITNPSYFAPAFYRAFATATSNATWNQIADNAYTLLNASLQGRTNGLVPAWCTGGSCNAPASNGATNDVYYQYDSHRTPWRIGLDYCWNGTPAAKTYLDKVSGFFAGKASNGIGRVFDIYNLSGMETTDAAVNSGSAIGTAASGAMSNTQYATFMNDGYQLVLDLLNRGEIGDRLAASMGTKSGYSYFNATVGMLMLLTMTGNFQAW